MMAVPQVGSIAFDLLKGVIHAQRPTVERLQLADCDGFGAKSGPQRAPSSELTATKYVADAAAWTTLQTDVQALIGTFVTITDEHGVAHGECFIESAAAGATAKAVRLIVSGSIAARLRCTVQFGIVRRQ